MALPQRESQFPDATVEVTPVEHVPLARTTAHGPAADLQRMLYDRLAADGTVALPTLPGTREIAIVETIVAGFSRAMGPLLFVIALGALVRLAI